MKLHTQILLGLVVGASVGVTVNLLTSAGPTTQKIVSLVSEPVGKLWLSALIMVVIPLILSTLSVGVAGLGDFTRLGRIGAVTLASFLGLTALSTLLGLAVMNAIAPGHSLPEAVKTELMATYKGQATEAMGLGARAFNLDLLYSVVPRNPVQAAAAGNMLGVIFFALMLGAGMALLPEERVGPLRRGLESLGHVTVAMIGLVMKAAPVGVFCLIFSVTARFGIHLLTSLSAFVVTVVGSLVAFQTLGYGLIVWLVGRHHPVDFFRKIRLVMLTAFTTSSSNATLPTTIQVAEQRVGIPREVAAFVLPLGATMNMNGTALFEGATVLFLAQVFGVELTLGQQLIVVLMSVVTAIGVAGIPGGSIPLLMVVLGMVGVPSEGIAIILGVDRLLDMCRTVLNVTGDVVTATIVTRAERLGLQPDLLAED